MSEQAVRPKFLTDLLAEIDGFDESLYPPVYEMEEGDKAIGDVTGWTRKLYSLIRYYARQGKLLAVEMEDAQPEDRDLRIQELAEVKYKHTILGEIMWGCLRSEFHCFSCPSVGLRRDWKFVESKDDDEDDPIKAAFMAMIQRSKRKREE